MNRPGRQGRAPILPGFEGCSHRGSIFRIIGFASPDAQSQREIAETLIWVNEGGSRPDARHVKRGGRGSRTPREKLGRHPSGRSSQDRPCRVFDEVGTLMELGAEVTSATMDGISRETAAVFDAAIGRSPAKPIFSRSDARAFPGARARPTMAGHRQILQSRSDVATRA